MKEKECLQCGKQFKPKRSTSKYCSQECQWLSMTKRDLSIHICKVCGKEFTLKNNIQLAHRICNTNKRDRYTLGGGSLNF